MYDAKNAKEVEEKTQLPKDSIMEGVITTIQDGVVKDFVKNLEKWEGDPNMPAINMHIEVKSGEELVKLEQVYTYKDSMGATGYSPRSNLGKYKEKYKKLPESGDQIKIITNQDGFGKIKLD